MKTPRIRAGGFYFSCGFAACSRALCARISPLLRPARQNRHAMQANIVLTVFPNPQQSHLVQKGRPFSSRTNKYKNMRPGGELKLAMSLSCYWQQSEVTPVILLRASPIFHSQIIPNTFPDFHTFRVIRLKQARHISPHVHTSGFNR